MAPKLTAQTWFRASKTWVLIPTDRPRAPTSCIHHTCWVHSHINLVLFTICWTYLGVKLSQLGIKLSQCPIYSYLDLTFMPGLTKSGIFLTTSIMYIKYNYVSPSARQRSNIYCGSILLDWYLVSSSSSLLRIYTKRAVRSKAVYTSTQVPFELKRYFFDRYLGVRYTSAVPRVARSVKTKLTSGVFQKSKPKNNLGIPTWWLIL